MYDRNIHLRGQLLSGSIPLKCKQGNSITSEAENRNVKKCISRKIKSCTQIRIQYVRNNKNKRKCAQGIESMFEKETNLRDEIRQKRESEVDRDADSETQ